MYTHNAGTEYSLVACLGYWTIDHASFRDGTSFLLHADAYLTFGRSLNVSPNDSWGGGEVLVSRIAVVVRPVQPTW